MREIISINGKFLALPHASSFWRFLSLTLTATYPCLTATTLTTARLSTEFQLTLVLL